jgi:hypothetical protein
MAWQVGAEVNSDEQFGQALNVGPFGWPWFAIENRTTLSTDARSSTITARKCLGLTDLINPISSVEERWMPG